MNVADTEKNTCKDKVDHTPIVMLTWNTVEQAVN